MGLAAKIPNWERIRRLALDRDDWRCRDCGKAGRLEVHHCQPLKDGGNNALANLLTVCVRCHKLRHKRPSPELAEWQRLVAELTK